MKISFNFFKRDKSKPLIFLEECLTVDEASKVKALDFETILNAGKEERLSIFNQFLNEDKAIWLNSRFEVDIILKNQKEGLMSWINNDKEVEPKWREEIIRKISELKEPLSKEDENKFIEDLAELKLGLGVTREEAQKITDLCKKMMKLSS